MSSSKSHSVLMLPTVQGVRVRSTRNANVLFHAVTCGILLVASDHRLDAADRAALRAGYAYVWEERSPAADAIGAGMERFTEGRHWYPSRVRDVSAPCSLQRILCPPADANLIIACRELYVTTCIACGASRFDRRLQDFLLYVEKDIEANEAAERNRMLR